MLAVRPVTTDFVHCELTGFPPQIDRIFFTATFTRYFTARLGAKRDFEVWTYDSDNFDSLNSGKMF